MNTASHNIWFRQFLCGVILTSAWFLPAFKQNQAHGAELLVSSAFDISTKAAQARPGDTLIMSDGVWQNADIIFKANGSNGSPITLRAQTLGQVMLTGNSRLRISGSYLVVEGLQFTNGYVTSGEVIAFQDATFSVANNCRLTNCTIVDYNPPNLTVDTKWVSFFGRSNRVDNCYFKGKANLGAMMVVWVDSQPASSANYHHIERNYFGSRPPLGTNGSNGGETIRIGTSDVSLNSSRTFVEHNLFEQCNGDAEIISSKSCDNVYRHNTFVDCEGALSLRHGNRCLVEANYFFGHRKTLTGGVRIVGEDHKVYNNYFSELMGTSARSPLAIMQGLVNSPLNGYFQVQRATVAFNTFVNCTNPLMIGLSGTLSGTTNVTTLPPADCIIANNVVLSTAGKLVDQRITPINLTWQGNIMFGAPLVISNNSGILLTDPKLVLGIDELWRPASNSPALGAAQGVYADVVFDFEGQLRPPAKDTGCDQFSNSPVANPPLQPTDVGPLWMRAPGTYLGWVTPSDITYGTPLGAPELRATANVPGTFFYLPPGGTVLNAGYGQTLSVIFLPNDTVNYTIVTQSVTINVLRTAPIISWANPTNIAYGIPLGTNQLNATSAVPGNFVYLPPAGTVLSTSNGHPLSVTFTPANTTNYFGATQSVTLNVVKATPVVTWSNPADVTNGSSLSSIQLNATANVPGAFSYAPAPGSILNAGSGQMLSVNFVPEDTNNYTTATKIVLINVTSGGKLVPTITWSAPADIIYGTPLSSLQLNATANIQGSFAYSPTAGTVLNKGNGQILSVTFTPDDTNRYTAATRTVTINVAPVLSTAMVRVAYIIPTNRVAQSHAIATLRNTVLFYQNWFRAQMAQNGFGPKTFTLEMEADGVTPRIRTVTVVETDSYLIGDLWGGRVVDAARAAGVAVGTPGQVWWLITETQTEFGDGSIMGGFDFGYSYSGSGDDSGWAMMGGDSLALCQPAYLTNNAAYDGFTVPEIGADPLQLGVSYPWFEGTTMSGISSSALGGGLRELAEAFGVAHDFRNDENFNGNLTGFGFRGVRGILHPKLYPYNHTRLSFGAALALNVSPYFNPGRPVIDDARPIISVPTAGAVVPVSGSVRIAFAATDVGGLSAAMLVWKKDSDKLLVDELVLSGTSVSRFFTTPYFDAGRTNEYTVIVFDLQGNKQSATTVILPSAGLNDAPQPFIRVSPASAGVGESVILDASATFDPEHGASLLEVEWDLNGDGVFDTVPTTELVLTNRYLTLGSRLVRARLTDAAGDSSLSTPVAVNITLCAATLSPLSRSHGFGSGSGTVTVTTSGNCIWSAMTTNDWIRPSTNVNTGSGQISYAVDANPDNGERIGALLIGDQWFVITQKQFVCTFALSPTNRYHGFGASSGTIKMTTKEQCSWGVINTNSWITITSATNFTGTGTVSYAITDNRVPNVRSGRLQLGDQIFTVNQWGTNCAFVLSAASRVHNQGVETGLVTVTTSSGCPWGVVNSNDWITVSPPASGMGNGSVAYTLAANPSADDRMGAMVIGDQVFLVRQLACSFDVTPSSQFFGNGAATGAVNIATGATCPWIVSNPNSWLTLLSSGSGVGNTTLRFALPVNPSGSPRTATLSVAGESFTVTQSGAPCSYQISPIEWVHGEGADVFEVLVNAGEGCPWEVANPVDWITILSSLTGVGPGSVIYSVDANPGPPRSGTLTIAGEEFSVEQFGGLRLARAGEITMSAGQTGCLKVELETHGTENAMGFSLCYDRSVVTYVSAQLGAGATGGTLSVNTNNTAQGQVGFTVAMPPGWSISAGFPPMVEVCFRAGVVSGTVTSPVALCDQPVQRRVVDVIGQTLPVQYVNGSIKITGECTLGEATDAPQLLWTTGGGALWACQTNVTHDGVEAAASGVITDSLDSWMETTVSGPGAFSFWWKVSSEPSNDRLRLYMDGNELLRIAGEVDWESRTFDVPAGSHVMRFRYSKNGSISAGQDRGWVDEVRFASSPPGIASQTSSQSVGSGSTVTFSVGATGTTPFIYQWLFNGANLTDGALVRGATTSSLTLSNVQSGNAGNYSVIINNSVGTVTSTNSVLTVTPFVSLAEGLDAPGLAWTTNGTAPYWVGQSDITRDGMDAVRSGAIADSQTTSFQTTLTGPGTISFWWKVSSQTNSDVLIFLIGSSEQARISGEVEWQQRSFAVASGSQTLKWTYSKNGSTSLGSDRGWVDQVQFSPAPTAITAHPVSQSADSGATVGFSVTASGTPPLTYQWQYNGASLLNGPGVSGVNTATLTLTNAQPAQAGAYSVLVGNAASSVTSSNAMLTITPLVPLPEGIDATNLTWTLTGTPPWVGQMGVTHDGQDAGRSGAIPDSGTTTFQTTVAGPGTISFWWKVSSEPSNDKLRFYLAGSQQENITGEVDWTWRSYAVASGNQLLEWRYTKNSSITGGQDRGWVDEVTFVPNNIPTAPKIVIHPLNRTVVAPATVSFGVAAIGSPTLGYQWQFNGVNLTNGGGFSGATTTNLTVTGALGGHSGAYSVVVSNAAGTAVSSNALLAVIAAPMITNQPASQNAIAGTTVNLSVGAIGQATLTYQWRFNGTNLANTGNISGATTAALKLTGVLAAQAGAYSVLVSNAAGSVLSADAALYVAVPPTFTSQPISLVTTSGFTVVLNAAVTGTAPLGYRWRSNGTNLFDGPGVNGAVTSSLTLSNVLPAQAGNYSLTASNTVGTATSANAVLTVLTPPVITIQPAGQSVGDGVTVTMTVAASGTGPLSYQWRFNGTNLANGGSLSGVNAASLMVANAQPVQGGSYSVVVSNAAGSATSGNALLRVIPALSLAQVVDADYLPWNTSLSAPWTAQTNVTHDGNGAARSGAIPHGQTSWLETTVLGPGTLRFWWKVSSETNRDWVVFSVSGAERASLSGAVDWQWESFDLPSGNQVVRWTYTKDASGTNGQDRAWLDEVIFTPNFGPTPPVIITQPASQDANPGDTVTFTTDASGTGPLSYQWSLNGLELFDGDTVRGATSPRLTLLNVQPSQEGLYRVTAKNAYSTDISSNAILTVVQTIPLPLALDTTNVGRIWIFGGYSAWRGQTDVSYDWIDSAQSGPLPNSQTNFIETTVLGPAAVTFWWKVSSETNKDRLRFLVNGVEMANISGEVDWKWRTFDLTNVSQIIRWSYGKDASGSAGQDRGWVDQVLIGPAQPQITREPDNQTADLGALVNISVSDTGSRPVNYIWRYNGNVLNDGPTITGATLGNLTLASVQPALAGSYSVIIANSGGRVISTNAYLSVSTGTPLALAVDATNATWNSGWTTGGGAPWRSQTATTHDGSDALQSGAIADSIRTYLETTVIGPGTISFWWKVSCLTNLSSLRFYVGGNQLRSIGGNVDWNLQTFIVPPGPQLLHWRYQKNSLLTAGQDAGWVDQVDYVQIFPPNVTNQPISRAVDAGMTVNFSAASAGSTPLSYQWRFNGANLTDGGVYSGVMTTNLRITAVQAAHAGIYSLAVSNAAGLAFSANATLTVIPTLQLADALETPTLNWTTNGSPPWVGQAGVTHDGVDAARSGVIADGGSVSMLTTVEGPGTLTFWWKVSSETNNDRLRLYADGSTLATISGEVDWQFQLYTLTAGPHTLEWRYSKNGSVAAGMDMGWVDQFQFGDGAVAPVIISQPLNQSVGAGAAAGFDVGAGGTAPFSYQWRLNGISLVNGGNISGATTANLRLANVQPAQAGAYSVLVGNIGGSAVSVNANLTVITAPAITSQPAGQSAGTGSSVTFNVAATGTPLFYQWRLNGTNLFNGGSISGATSATLTLTNLQFAQAGNYSVIVSNAERVVISSNALLSVIFVVPLMDALDRPDWTWSTTGTPAWFGQTNLTFDGVDSAQSGTINDSGSTAFQTTITGPGTVSFWWKVSSETNKDILQFSVGGTQQASLSGEADWQQLSFSIPSGSQVLKWTYSKNGSLAVGQDRGWVDLVQFIAVPATVTAQPLSQTVDAETTVNLSVAAAGTPPFSYQWRFNGANLADGPLVRGATNATLTLSNVLPAQTGFYSVVVSNADGADLSANALLSVTPLVPLAEALDTTNLVWTLSGSPAWVGQGVLTHDGVDAARISAVPDSGSASLQTTVTGPGAVTFWWKVSSETNKDLLTFLVNGTEQARLSGEIEWQRFSLDLPSGSQVLKWTYTKGSSGAAGQDRGWVDQVTFGPVAPVFVRQPVNQNADAGGTVSFNAAVSGTPPFSYQWQFDGANLVNGGIVSGTTTTNLTLTGVAVAQSGSYSLLVSNALGTVLSASAALNVLPLVSLAEALDTVNLNWATSGTPVWVGQSAVNHDGADAARSGAIADSGITTFQTTVTGPGTISFWWKVSSEPANDKLRFYIAGTQQENITGEVDWTNRSFTVPSGSQLLEWRYTKNSSITAGQDRGWVDQVQFGPTPPSITTQPLSQVADQGATVSFTVAAGGATPLAYQWRLDGVDLVNGGNISGARTNTLTITSAQAGQSGNYSVVISNGGGTLASSNALLQVATILPLAESLDATNLTWTTTGTPVWAGQSVVTHDGQDAARSGAITHSGTTTFQTTVTGPGTINFWWKSSSEFDADKLRFYIAGNQQENISGESDWTNRTYAVASGSQLLEWRYTKNASVTAGQDRGWVDQVIFSPTPPTITTQPLSRNVDQGATVSFSVVATSPTPLTYQWQRNGINLANGGNITGARTNTLTLSGVQPGDSGNYSVLVGNAGAPLASSNAVLQVTQILPLADALDTPGWIWITGGSQPWIGQPLVARDGVSAARGGVVTNNQTTSLQTTVIGPGTIGFAWKVSSETNNDTLRFLIGATEQARISGEVDWNRRNFSIPAGSQVLQWTYSKNGSLAAGRDLAWVDEVGFAASLAPAELQPATTNISAPTVVQITMSGTKVTLVWDANPTKTYKVLYKDSVSETEWQVVDGEVLVRWKIANGIVSPDSVTATVVDVLAGTSRFYRVLEE